MSSLASSGLTYSSSLDSAASSAVHQAVELLAVDWSCRCLARALQDGTAQIQSGTGACTPSVDTDKSALHLLGLGFGNFTQT
jgi:hypothetical protein